jgi:hypothetical protein
MGLAFLQRAGLDRPTASRWAVGALAALALVLEALRAASPNCSAGTLRGRQAR